LPLLDYAFRRGITTWDTVGSPRSDIFTFRLSGVEGTKKTDKIEFFSNQADAYSQGKSEEIVGKALKTYNIPRNRVVILSKCYFGQNDKGEFVSTNDGPWTNTVGLSRKHIFDAVHASVQRLGTYIDVLQIHRMDRETPREEIMRALNDVVNTGKVRYIGASSV
jgi:aryl-alcohol dehydrogenase-like predicted oxidoreductase